MSSYSPIYRLPFINAGDPITETLERIRYTTIDRQLYTLFTFLGDGIITGWEIQSPLSTDSSLSVNVTAGSGVAMSMAIATGSLSNISLNSGTTEITNYIYVQLQPHSPHTAVGIITASTTEQDSNLYLLLGKVTVSASGKLTIQQDADSGRTELTLLRYLLQSVSTHVHSGAPGEPDKIDLQNHVQGILSSANIEDLPASKITSGIISKERFNLSHENLNNIGTLKHNEIDGLVENFQKLNASLFGDVMSANLIQLILSLKHVWANIDDYMYNFAAVIPGIGNNTFLDDTSFIDVNASDAEIDYVNHRIRGRYVEAKEIAQYVMSSVEDFSWDKDGQTSFDSRYIAISSESRSYAYGYGYGYGIGLNYFDVLYEVEDGVETSAAVAGTTIGYGTDDFELSFTNSYGFGYGWERLAGFDDTLNTTNVNLVSFSSTVDIHNKDSENYPVLDDTYDIATGRYVPNSDKPTQIQFLIQSADQADDNIRPTSSSSININQYMSALTTGGVQVRSDSDKGLVYLSWQTEIDMSTNSYLNVQLSQVKYQRDPDNFINIINRWSAADFPGWEANYDAYWSPDIGMDLIIESTVDRGVNGKFRYFYKYYEGSDPDDYRFLDITDNTIFENNRIQEASDLLNKPSVASLQAYVISGRLQELGGYKIPDTYGTLITSTLIQDQIDAILPIYEVTISEAISNVTGIYLYTVNDVDPLVGSTSKEYCFDRERDEATPVLWPQGQRNTMGSFENTDSLDLGHLSTAGNPTNMVATYPTGRDGAGTKVYAESTMLVDLEKIYISSSSGYRYDPDDNKLEDLVITFPDPVQFNSISWISTEPSDSIVYLQVKRLSIGETGNADAGYNTDIIYTNKGTELVAAQSSSPYGEAWFSTDIETRVSGSDFPSGYTSVKKIVIRAVLLPSSDLKISPVLNSITVNYTSNTTSGELVINSESEWSNARVYTNITPVTEDGEDYIEIDLPTASASTVVSGRVKNLLYGTKGALVEVGNISGKWSSSTKNYTGANLPLTIFQEFNGNPLGITGYVTDLKKMKNGDIVFLDDYSNRIVFLNSLYSVEKIVASEYAYRDTSSTPTISDSNTATLKKAIYNSALGDNGVLYLVFSHELQAWEDMYGFGPSNYDPTLGLSGDGSDATVDLSKISITYKGESVDFTSSDVYACDRGVLSIILDEDAQNFIESIDGLFIRAFFSTDADGILDSSASCVKFKGTNAGTPGTKKVLISEPSYSMIYAPIPEIVAFDVDEDEILYILKRSKPYAYDFDYPSGSEPDTTHASEPWYVSFDSKDYWSIWGETTGSDSGTIIDVITISTFRSDPLWEPNFFLNNIYGYRGSVERKDDYLLLTISGEKDSDNNRNGILAFKKLTDSSGRYGTPSEFLIESSSVSPMAARFDPATYDSDTNVYGDLFVALSDLSYSSGTSGKSRVEKRRENISSPVLWTWGSQEIYEDVSLGINKFAITVNDVRPFMYSDTQVVIST